MDVPGLSGLEPEFTLLRPLGEGAMAEVFLAREAALGRLVAIKVVRDTLASDAEARARFEREARSAAGLSHPNVVEVHRVAALPDGRPYLVMEYVEGQNLADALHAGTVDAGMAREVLRGVASALGAAHERGIVHRDVRPANILWDPRRRRAVLTDFGIAGVLETGGEAATRLTRAGQVLGDPQYTSPEHLVGDPVTGASDVYALGIVGYQLLAGRGPYAAQGSARIAAAHLREQAVPLSSLRPDLPPALARLLTACLAKRPEQRPRMADLVAHLERPDDVLVSASGARGRTQSLEAAVEQLPALQSFLQELKRRRVFNVAAVYAVASFGLLQVGELILPALPVPEWAYTALVATILAAFPVALVLAWIFDVGSDGLTRSRSDPTSVRGPTLRVLQVTGLALSLGVAILIGWWILSA
ncbi:MAG: serine/threonine-protein kinase [Gemmatimonadota bacterium]